MYTWLCIYIYIYIYNEADAFSDPGIWPDDFPEIDPDEEFQLEHMFDLDNS